MRKEIESPESENFLIMWRSTLEKAVSLFGKVRKENERGGQEQPYIEMEKRTGEEDVSFQFPNCDSLGSG